MNMYIMDYSQLLKKMRLKKKNINNNYTDIKNMQFVAIQKKKNYIVFL